MFPELKGNENEMQAADLFPNFKDNLKVGKRNFKEQTS